MESIKDVPLTRTVLDLASFNEVTIAKEMTFTPVANQHEALARLGNNGEKLLAVINEGLRAEERRIERTKPEGWLEMDEDGKVTTKQFSGIPADPKIVNGMVLMLAKTVYDYSAVDSPEHRKASKDRAREFIKNAPVIREALAKSAALKDDE
jgi:hypothetical protein